MRHQSPHTVRTFAASLALATLLAAANAADPPAIGTKKGQMYPDFLLPTVDGDTLRLSDHRGKKVLLFHFASW